MNGCNYNNTMQFPYLHNYITSFLVFNNAKKQLISLDMVDYIIASTLKFLFFHNDWIIMIFLMMGQMKNIINILIKLFLMVM